MSVDGLNIREVDDDARSTDTRSTDTRCSVETKEIEKYALDTPDHDDTHREDKHDEDEGRNHRAQLLALRFTQEYEKLHLMKRSKELKHHAELLKLKQKNAADEIQLNMMYEADILQLLNEADILTELVKLNTENLAPKANNGANVMVPQKNPALLVPNLLVALIDETKKNHAEILEDITKLTDGAKPYLEKLEELQEKATHINKDKDEKLITQKYASDLLDLESKPSDADELSRHEASVFTKRQAINDRAFLKMHARDETKLMFQITNTKVDEVLRNVRQVDKAVDQFECGYLRRKKDKLCGKKFIAPLKQNLLDDKPCSPFPRARLHKKRDDLCDFDFKLPFNREAKKSEMMPFAFNRNKFCSTPSTDRSPR